MLRRAAEGDPADPDYHYILGCALLRAGRHPEALASLREATRSVLGDPAYHAALGTVLFRLARYQEAADAFQEVLRRQPQDTAALNGLGVCQLAQGLARAALQTLQQALQRDPQCAPARGNLGIALWRLDRQREAERALRAAARSRPGHAGLQRNLGRALLALGKSADAARCFRTVLEHQPDNAEARLDLGDALFALGQWGDAEAEYQRGALLDPALAAARQSSSEAREAMVVERVRAEVQAAPDASAHGMRRLLELAGAAGHALTRLGLPPAGRMGPLLAVAALVLLVRAAFGVLPPYLEYYAFRDEVQEAARAPVRDDALVRERVLHAAYLRRLEERIRAGSLSIESRGQWRTVALDYDVPVSVLPGMVRSLTFRIRVEQPFLARDDAGP